MKGRRPLPPSMTLGNCRSHVSLIISICRSRINRGAICSFWSFNAWVSAWALATFCSASNFTRYGRLAKYLGEKIGG